MTVDLHSAVRTAVDAQRARATARLEWADRQDNDALLRMCDWADDVLARHTPYECRRCADNGHWVCNPHRLVDAANCPEVKAVAAAFGVETGETP